MRAVFGLLLVMLGLAMAIVWMPGHDSERQLSVVTDIATQGTARRSDASDRSGRTFSPTTPLIAVVEQPGANQPHHFAGVARVVRVAPGTDTAAPAVVTQLQPSNTTSVAQAVTGASVVTPSMVATVPARPADTGTASRVAATPETSRYELVRNLQRELKRVGCYAGDIDGDWGTGSRRAMAAFTDRVNASLPIEQPDFILLTLVQGHQGSICGRGCSPGQTVADNGRCVGGSVVAQVRRSYDRTASQNRSGQDRRNPTMSNDVVQYTSTHTAMTQTATTAPPQGTGWTTQVTRGPDGSPSAVASASGTAAAAALAVTAAARPLAGRMAMGGPQVPTAAIAAPAYDRSPARSAVRIEPPQADGNTARVEKRERPRRTARGGTYRSAPAYRTTRISGPAYYASAPRRGRSWTGSFFGFP